jgi:hypothetical protein
VGRAKGWQLPVVELVLMLMLDCCVECKWGRGDMKKLITQICVPECKLWNIITDHHEIYITS